MTNGKVTIFKIQVLLERSATITVLQLSSETLNTVTINEKHSNYIVAGFTETAAYPSSVTTTDGTVTFQNGTVYGAVRSFYAIVTGCTANSITITMNANVYGRVFAID